MRDPDAVGELEFERVVDRSAGGPSYRIQVRLLMLLLVVVLGCTAVVGRQLVHILEGQKKVTESQNLVLDRLDQNAKDATDARARLLAITQALRECTTPNPGPGQVLDPADAIHECFNDGVARTGAAVADIGRIIVAATECAQRGSSDVESCVRVKLHPE